MNENLKLQAWVDGELPAAERAVMERELAARAGAAAVAAELRAIKMALAGNEPERAVPDTREFYWSQIQRRIGSESAKAELRPREAGWRHWLSPLAGLAGLACMLALAVRPASAPAFDELSLASGGMDAVTFHDQSAHMTVVWLSDSSREEAPAEAATAPDSGGADPDVEME